MTSTNLINYNPINLHSNLALIIQNLNTFVLDQPILHDLNLEFQKSQIIFVLGKNGSGKSSLAQAIMGNPDYVCEGRVMYKNQNLLELSVDQRSQLGVFVSSQSPIEIAGVNLANYLKLIVNYNRQARNLSKLPTPDLLVQIKSFMKKLNWDEKFLKRGLNEGMSGGERKKCEILQMLLLDSDLVILDEIDSGLDIDAVEVICRVVRDFLNPNKTLIIISHSPKILEFFEPNQVVILKNGFVERVGGRSVATSVFAKGFE